jgi:hypothetical protein
MPDIRRTILLFCTVAVAILTAPTVLGQESLPGHYQFKAAGNDAFILAFDVELFPDGRYVDETSTPSCWVSGGSVGTWTSDDDVIRLLPEIPGFPGFPGSATGSSSRTGDNACVEVAVTDAGGHPVAAANVVVYPDGIHASTNALGIAEFPAADLRGSQFVIVAQSSEQPGWHSGDVAGHRGDNRFRIRLDDHRQSYLIRRANEPLFYVNLQLDLVRVAEAFVPVFAHQGSTAPP